MAYRRGHGISKASTFKVELHHDENHNANDPSPPSLSSSFSFNNRSSSSSLAAQAIKASAARRHPSLSFVFAKPHFNQHLRSKSSDTNGDVSKSGVWGVLAQKAKEILEDDKSSPQHNDVLSEKLKSHSFDVFSRVAHAQEGVDKTAVLRTPIKLKGISPEDSGTWNPWQQPVQTGDPQTILETQLKASRDVAMATAAKAKLLLRELKTVKADMAFSKARCAQLEEENKLLRDREGSDIKGQNVNRADDDLIRLQLETLLAEKGRLASENEVYARENRFLREIVEYHQLTTQDVVYLDEGMEEVTELYTTGTAVPRVLPKSPRSPLSRGSQTKAIFSVSQQQDQEDKSTSELLDEAPPNKHAK
ncbi:hypothetical protein Fmac_028420 [Flemingia macrophylla]|uniref:Uncharacterized protein n=1 Tax=Flemingia macrophylla TaxID=520843 RepID=A0ABD1L7G8_9FABA